MTESSVPSFAYLIVAVAVIANLATAWIVMLAMGENNGSLFAAGPPTLAALSCLLLVLFHYEAFLSREISFWGSAILAALGLWGAWVDYVPLADRRKAAAKARSERNKPR